MEFVELAAKLADLGWAVIFILVVVVAAVGLARLELSFDSHDHGRLTYATDQYTERQDNVRAIALSLEALRAVERWGVSKGRQYTGFAQLTAGPGLEGLGRELVERYGSVAAAMRATRPDTGGATASARDFQAVITYRDTTAVAL